VIHAAGEVHIGWQGLDLHRAVNVDGTRSVVEAARRAGARLVHVSSVDALGVRSLTDPVDETTAWNGAVLCPYVITKREGEQVVRMISSLNGGN
jgi:dihydroflavonol-4-reductase